MNPSIRSFLDDSARYLRDVYMNRLDRATADLPPADVWWRPHPGVVSIGTILLHLEGNVRQWILGALGGQEDHRDRDAEFAAVDGPPIAELLANLRATVEEAAVVIEGLGDEALVPTYEIQQNLLSGQEAVYHVVEHFSWHTGQAIWISKMRRGEK